MTTLASGRFADTIANLRSGGRSDVAIVRTLGLTPAQAAEYGLKTAAAPESKPKAPAATGGIANILRGGDLAMRLRRVAGVLLQRADGVRAAAAAEMARHFDELKPDEQSEVIRRGCLAIIGDKAVRLQDLLDHGPKKPTDAWTAPPQGGERMAARLRNMGAAYDWKLPGGKPIGDATLADLDAAIAHHSRKLHTHARLGHFYRTVRDRLAASGKPVVAEAIDHTTLESLQKDVTP